MFDSAAGSTPGSSSPRGRTSRGAGKSVPLADVAGSPPACLQLDPTRMLFVLHETHFAARRTTTCSSSKTRTRWFNEVMGASTPRSGRSRFARTEAAGLA